MKKIYMSVGALLITATMFGQYKIDNNPTKAKLGVDMREASTKAISTNDKAPGQVLWNEDFTGGFPAGWSTGGTTNGGTDWVINNAAISATFTNTGPIASTSGGNHMLFFGETIAPIADRDAYFQTSGIALNGATSFTVRFEEKFRLCCAGAAELNLVVSTDPTFSTGVFTYDARGGVAINAQSADPMVRSINISDNFGGSSATIYLRFHWASGASHYYWMIDDIDVLESVDNDLFVFGEYHGSLGLNYTRILETQLQPIDFAIEVTNVGATDQTNTIVTAEVNGGGIFTGTSAPTTVTALAFGGTVAGSSDSLFTTTQWTPPATPLNTPYSIDLTVTSDSTDFSPGDNMASFAPLEVDQWLYAVDDFSATPGNGGGYNNTPTPPTEDFEAGSYFDIIANDIVYAINVVVGSNTDVGAIIDVVLYDLTVVPGTFTQVDRSNVYVVTAGDLGNSVRLELLLTPTLNAGSTYFAAVHGWGGTTFEFFYGTSGTSPDNSGPVGATSLIFYPSMTTPNTGENFFTTNTPMVRMNFEMPAGVEDGSDLVDFNVYPNPSTTGEFNINLDANVSENVSLSVKNLVGQTIINKTIAVSGKTVETVSLSNYSKGVYFLTIDNKTVKLIVE